MTLRLTGNYLKQKIASPVDCDGHHVHERGRYIAIEEEREDSAERGSQGPSLVNIPRYHSVTTDNKLVGVISRGQILPSFNFLPN